MNLIELLIRKLRSLNKKNSSWTTAKGRLPVWRISSMLS